MTLKLNFHSPWPFRERFEARARQLRPLQARQSSDSDNLTAEPRALVQSQRSASDPCNTKFENKGLITQSKMASTVLVALCWTLDREQTATITYEMPCGLLWLRDSALSAPFTILVHTAVPLRAR